MAKGVHGVTISNYQPLKDSLCFQRFKFGIWLLGSFGQLASIVMSFGPIWIVVTCAFEWVWPKWLGCVQVYILRPNLSSGEVENQNQKLIYKEISQELSLLCFISDFLKGNSIFLSLVCRPWDRVGHCILGTEFHSIHLHVGNCCL